LKKNNINFAKLEPGASDEILNEGTGAAVIYGSSGGVMESALRTANALACQKSTKKICNERLEFKEVRGLKSLKEATVNIAGRDVRVAVVNGIGQIGQVLEHLKDYDYIEVMACVGGCIGGGGQPIPTTPEIRRQRIEGLYAIDKSKKIRKAHENKAALEVLKWLEDNKLSHKVLHTKYKKRSR
jgi:iron only hydrogenase large subunit-like protein